MKRRKTTGPRPLPRPFAMPWGKGEIIEEAGYEGEWHEPAIQLMEYEDGSLAIRFAHYANGSFQRSPLIVNAEELKLLKAALKKSPKLKKILKALVS